MEYKVFADTNQLFSHASQLEKPFGNQIETLAKFVEEHDIENVTICIPEIVLKERLQHKLDEIHDYILEANKYVKTLQKIGHDLEEIHPLKNYEELLQDNIDSYLKKYDIYVAPYPSVGKDEIIDRAVRKMKPFIDNDIGFKDTLIFLSLIEDAQNGDDNTRYIFCTRDGGFDEDVRKEFQEETGRDLYIVKSIVKATEKLDELLPLNRHLEERNARIENLVSMNVGEMMIIINETLQQDGGLYTVSSWRPQQHHVLSEDLYAFPTTTSDEKEIIAYTHTDTNLTDIREVGSDRYVVGVSVTVSAKYKKDSENSIYVHQNPVVYNPMGMDGGSKIKIFTFFVTCDLRDNSVEINQWG